MKSHYDSDPQDREDAGNQGDAQPKPVRPEPVRTPSAFDATFLMVMGVGCVCGGLLLSLGPRMSWKLSQIATGFKHLGIEGGVVIMGGLVLCGLGLLRRGQHASRAPTIEQAEDRALLEQLTKDSLRLEEGLSQVESGLAHVEAELTSSRRALEDQMSRGTQAVLAAVTAPREENSPDEAIFRLAASLDQVGMRIDQRLKTQYTALQDHLEDVGAAILSARNQVQGLHLARDEHAAALREEVQSTVENALEGTGFWSTQRKDGKAPSLGVLDSIDEHEEVPHVDLGQVEAALPMSPEEAREHGAANEASFQMDAIDTKTRLVQLSTLLSDPKLREALEGIRNAAN